MLKRFTLGVMLVASLLLISTNCKKTPATPEKKRYTKSLLSQTWILPSIDSIGSWVYSLTKDDISDSFHFSLNVKEGAKVFDLILAKLKGTTDSAHALHGDTLTPIAQMSYWWVAQEKYDSLAFIVINPTLRDTSSTVYVKVEKVYWK
jgi:hypothetical protein